MILLAIESRKKKLCPNCKHGDTNFWGYLECWKFNQRPDGSVTSETADRERTSIRLNNPYGDCKYYEE